MNEVNKLKTELENIDALIAEIKAADAADPVLDCWQGRRKWVMEKLAMQ